MLFVWSTALSTLADARSFTLSDQYGVEHSIAFPLDRPMVLLIADRAGSEQLDDWLVPLAEHYADELLIQGVAELSAVPRLLRPMVRALFRQDEAAPVLLDWTGDVANGFGARADVANVYLLAPDGEILHRVNGAFTTPAWQALRAAIDASIRRPAPPAPNR